MSTNRLLNSLGLLVVLGFGIFIGLAIHQLWTPQSHHLAPAARAAASESTVPPSQIGGSPAAQLPSRETEITRTVAEVSPSVVTVGAVKRQIFARPAWDGFFLRPQYRYFESRETLPYMGSGFLVDRDKRLVMTNYHVIENSESVFVTFPSGDQFDATVVDADKYIDVAMLRLDAEPAELPEALPLGESQDLMIGEQVLAIGNPFGNLIEDSTPTVTVGYVSALHRSFRPDTENERVYADMIQTDAAINPGNSGGPLVNVHGEVVGMNTFIFSPSGANTGIGFAIPGARIRHFIDEIETHGRLRPLLLDFDFRSVMARNFRGVKVFRVFPGGPAERCGLQPGDLLLEVDGRAVETREDFDLLFKSKQVGEEMRLKVWREGDLLDLIYTVEQAPQVQPGRTAPLADEDNQLLRI